jgi:hypothetical protein
VPITIQKLKLTAFSTGTVYKLKNVKGDQHICRVMFYSGKYGNVMVKFTFNRPRRPRGAVDVQLYSFFNLGIRWAGWVVNAMPR